MDNLNPKYETAVKTRTPTIAVTHHTRSYPYSALNVACRMPPRNAMLIPAPIGSKSRNIHATKNPARGPKVALTHVKYPPADEIFRESWTTDTATEAIARAANARANGLATPATPDIA